MDDLKELQDYANAQVTAEMSLDTYHLVVAILTAYLNQTSDQGEKDRLKSIQWIRSR